MIPVICFGPNGKMLQSRNYERISCPKQESLTDFLNRMARDYTSQMKIVQISFEALHAEIFQSKMALYPVAKAHVFVLRDYTDDLESAHAIATEFSLNWSPLEDEQQFKNKVGLIREFISSGRLYQVNLTSVLKAQTDLSCEMLFQHYRLHFAGDYHAFLPLPEVDVACFSPELFLQKTGTSLITRPIKGSSADTPEAVSGLMSSAKENAELSMIVDLLRNDLQQAEPNQSAVVTKHRELMKLGYIQHTFSEVEIKTEQNLPAILQATFPGGSISGCPKTESLHVIAETEKYRRQVYTGAIGWWKDNDFALNLAIRTLIQYEKNCYYHAGCGIVYDSESENEWREFLLKAGKLQLKS